MNRLMYFSVLIVCLVLTRIAASQTAQEINSKEFSEQEIKRMSIVRAVIETNLGKIELIFFPDVSPDHVNNFIELVKNGFYNGTAFHNVRKDGYVKGGDPNSKSPSTHVSKGIVRFGRFGAAGTDYRIPKGYILTFGNVRYETIKEVTLRYGQTSVTAPIVSLVAGSNANITKIGTKLEIKNPMSGFEYAKTETQIIGGTDYPSYLLPKPRANERTHKRGSLSMGSRFYPTGMGYEFIICTTDETDADGDLLSKILIQGLIRELNRAYIVFGEVISGMDVIDKIAKQREKIEMKITIIEK